MNNTKLIQDYYADILSEKEVVAYEERLLKDKAFAEEVAQYDKLSKAGEKKATLSIEESKDTRSFIKRYGHIYIAAVVIISAIITFQFFEKKATPQELYISYYQIYPNTLQPYETAVTKKDELSKAFVAYESKEFEKATQHFTNSIKFAYNYDIVFYKAMSLLASNHPEESLTLLSALKKEETSLTGQLYWYSALIALKNGQKDKALGQLDSLHILKSDYNRTARRLLKEEILD